MCKSGPAGGFEIDKLEFANVLTTVGRHSQFKFYSRMTGGAFTCQPMLGYLCVFVNVHTLIQSSKLTFNIYQNAVLSPLYHLQLKEHLIYRKPRIQTHYCTYPGPKFQKA